MEILSPSSREEFVSVLQSAASAGTQIELGGAFSKRTFGGPIAPGSVPLSTRNLHRVIQYEPDDLTISVEAGIPFQTLQEVTAKHRQMVPLDPPFTSASTVGGVIASNLSGPRRKLYGSGRDLIIGMSFATVEGKVIQSGGMVVKNVAGLDMSKLLIGSYGTLAAILTVNFRLHSMPESTRTFVLSFPSAAAACARRNELLKSPLQPSALDFLNASAADRCGLPGTSLLLQAEGSSAVLARYTSELQGAAIVESTAESALWNSVREFTPHWLSANEQGTVVRVSLPLMSLEALATASPVPLVARAATGVAYLYFDNFAAARSWLTGPGGSFASVIECAPLDKKPNAILWPDPGSSFEMMRKVKTMFDPGAILNAGRLYGRL